MKVVNTSKVEMYKQQNHVKPSSTTQEKTTLKEKPQIEEPKDHVDISVLKEEAEKAHAHLRQIVEDLLRRQGIEVDKLKDLKPEEIKVDQQARDEAKQMIAPGGPLSAEAVSDRIVDFAKSISGGDKEKLALLRDAIEEGFQQAKEMMGGELPDISNKTYELIQEKLDAWENESNE